MHIITSHCFSGYLNRNPTFGAIPKILASATVGYFAGVASYINKCQEKIMKLPNSELAEYLKRQRQKGQGEQGMYQR